ncbi:RodZ domain-containing protein [Hirschia litorea]|uniref:RodZ domain-containing protein n=1 Tax=Hirschia litorea TaxID=1199156 RepID=A0ABW2IKE3_9PROT
MSNAANKNGENSEAMEVASANAVDHKVTSPNSSNKPSDIKPDIPDTNKTSPKNSGAGDAPVAASKPPHLVVVAPDALNAERMGPRLRAAREAKGWTLEVASKETRIHKDYLGAIEDMMPNLLPGMPKYQSYLRGYLGNYAKALGISDPQDVTTRFLSECGLLAMELTEEEAATVLKKTAEKQSRSWIVPVLASVAATMVACAIGGALILKPWKADETPVTIAKVNASPKTSFTNSEALAPVSASDLTLRAIERSWIEVRGSDGTVYLSRELAPGDVYVPRVGAGWTITARDGGAFEWRLAGQSLGTLDEAGLPVYSAAVDDALKRKPLESNDLLN